MDLDTIICGDNVAVLATLPDNCIDLTVTSPPYDNLRKYNGYTWDFEGVAQQLYRVTKLGGVVVWVVGDRVRDGDETCMPFLQTLHFRSLGFKLHDTMVWNKENVLPRETNGNRYEQHFEYMFVLSKGRPRVTNIRRLPCKRAGQRTTSTCRENHSDRQRTSSTLIVNDTKPAGNVWVYSGGANATKDKCAFEHPAIFPEKLVEDHILSWSNEGDVVLDPFSGSGTTCKMALLNNRRYIGIDISEEYCELARQRIAKAEEEKRDEQWQTTLF